MIQLDYLEWDSTFFGKNIFCCHVQHSEDIEFVEKELTKNNGDLCYIFSKENLNIKNNDSFFLADRKVTFYKNNFNSEQSFIPNEIVSSEKFTTQLLNLTILSGKYSRFKIDKVLSPKFIKMYQTWLEKSLSRQIANEVFVFEKENAQLGFVTIKKINKTAVVGLIAVDEAQQGKKIGSLLLRKTESWCIKNDIHTLEIATQMNNEQACAFYKRNGYNVKQVEYIYHCYKK